VLLSLQVLCILAAIETIPVGLAILVYYLYPFEIALILAVFERHRLPSASVLAMLVAFAGLALALGPRMDALDGRGLALAGFAATAFSVVFVWSGRLMAGADHYRFLFHVMAAGATFLMAIALVRGEALAWPARFAGWVAFLGSAVMFCSATLTMFLAIGLIGALKMSFIDFGSPVWTIVLGFLILGEQLTAIQGTGAALVVGAIVAHQIAETRRR
jgi:DME family drug/metabolite transporter